MADVFIVTPWLDSGPYIADNDTAEEVLQFDIATTEGHNESIEATRNPVEEGADVTDHASDLPDELSMTVVMSDTPLGGPQEEEGLARKKYSQLLDIMREKEPVTVVTGLKVYENMLLESVSVTRDGTSGYAVTADLSFVEIIIADQVYVQIPEKYLRNGDKNSSEADQGNQQSEDATLSETCKSFEGVSGRFNLRWCYKCPGGIRGDISWEDCPPASPRRQDQDNS